MRKYNLYQEQRDLVGAKALKILRERGEKQAIEIYQGCIHALVMALIAVTGRNKTDAFLKELIGDIPPPRTKPTLVYSRSA